MLNAVLGSGIIMARESREGGPYRIFMCPYCLKESMVEESKRGRWFASPNLKLGLLDYLFSLGTRANGDEQSRLILKAISWYRDNEERRRYFFERDGDQRFSGASILVKLWPWGLFDGDEPVDSDPDFAEKVRRARAERKAREDERRKKEEEQRAEGDRKERSRPPRPNIVTPQEILGVSEQATSAEITRRFHFLAVRYHPDKVHHMGQEFQDEAHRKFVELQRAYKELISESRRRHSSAE